MKWFKFPPPKPTPLKVADTETSKDILIGMYFRENRETLLDPERAPRYGKILKKVQDGLYLVDYFGHNLKLVDLPNMLNWELGYSYEVLCDRDTETTDESEFESDINKGRTI